VPEPGSVDPEREHKGALDGLAQEHQSKWQADISEAHRAIGRYFVAFSRLVAQMRGMMSQRLVIVGDDKVELAELAFANATAQPIADSFFAMCRYDGDLSDAEKGVCELLCRAVTDEIEWRNKFAHGDWWISPRFGDPAKPELIRMKPKAREGIPAELTQHPPKEMDARSDALWALIRNVTEFGALALGLSVIAHIEGKTRKAPRRAYRVEDVFAYTPPRKSGRKHEKAKFERSGPRATEVVPRSVEVF
jgi:hypothetical protein